MKVSRASRFRGASALSGKGLAFIVVLSGFVDSACGEPKSAVVDRVVLPAARPADLKAYYRRGDGSVIVDVYNQSDEPILLRLIGGSCGVKVEYLDGSGDGWFKPKMGKITFAFLPSTKGHSKVNMTSSHQFLIKVKGSADIGAIKLELHFVDNEKVGHVKLVSELLAKSESLQIEAVPYPGKNADE